MAVGGAGLAGKAAGVWDAAPIPRGFAIERMLGGNLPPAFPKIDRLENGIATSIKSLDLNAKTYQSAEALGTRLTSYVDDVIDFSKGSRGETMVEYGTHFTERHLQVAIPRTPTAAQQSVIDTAIDYGRLNGVNVYTTVIQ